MISVVLKDGSRLELQDNTTVYDLAKSISNSLAKAALVGEVNGKLVDLSYELKDGDQVNIITYKDEKGVEVL